jgi:hypothetical protein
MLADLRIGTQIDFIVSKRLNTLDLERDSSIAVGMSRPQRAIGGRPDPLEFWERWGDWFGVYSAAEAAIFPGLVTQYFYEYPTNPKSVSVSRGHFSAPLIFAPMRVRSARRWRTPCTTAHHKTTRLDETIAPRPQSRNPPFYFPPHLIDSSRD